MNHLTGYKHQPASHPYGFIPFCEILLGIKPGYYKSNIFKITKVCEYFSFHFSAGNTPMKRIF